MTLLASDPARIYHIGMIEPSSSRLINPLASSLAFRVNAKVHNQNRNFDFASQRSFLTASFERSYTAVTTQLIDIPRMREVDIMYSQRLHILVRSIIAANAPCTQQ